MSEALAIKGICKRGEQGGNSRSTSAGIEGAGDSVSWLQNLYPSTLKLVCKKI